MRDIQRTFLDFMDRVPFYGMVVACNDDPILRRVLPQLQRRTITYGTRRGSDFRVVLEKIEGPTVDHRPVSRFHVHFHDRNLGEFNLHVPGAHNVLNATAAIAVGIGLDISVDHIRGALDSFRGVDRRFQLRGQAAGVTVIDDYGHHPTEIKATLAAARQCDYKRIHVVFQPHRYTRTQSLMEEFAKAFHDADSVFVLDIYAASEQPIAGITGEVLAGRIPRARYVPSFVDAADRVAAVVQEGDMVLTLGAGSVYQLGPMILERLKARQAAGVPS
jgi:UDP-N-acetylmuramate--alanine ligase